MIWSGAKRDVQFTVDTLHHSDRLACRHRRGFIDYFLDMLTIKSLHIIFIVTWFAAIFYLPRLFVYHSMSTNPVLHAQFQVMERKLFWGIATPSAVLTVILGLWLTWLLPAYVHHSWFWLKAAAVVVLLAYHVHCCILMLRLRHDPHYRSHVWFRWYNEVPIVILIYIVFLVEFKPI